MNLKGQLGCMGVPNITRSWLYTVRTNHATKQCDPSTDFDKGHAYTGFTRRAIRPQLPQFGLLAP